VPTFPQTTAKVIFSILLKGKFEAVATRECFVYSLAYPFFCCFFLFVLDYNCSFFPFLHSSMENPEEEEQQTPPPPTEHPLRPDLEKKEPQILDGINDILKLRAAASARCQKWRKERLAGGPVPLSRIRLEQVDVFLMARRIDELLLEANQEKASPVDQERLEKLERLQRHLSEVQATFDEHDKQFQKLINSTKLEDLLHNRSVMFTVANNEVIKEVRYQAGSGGLVGCSLNPVMCLVMGLITAASQINASANRSNAQQCLAEWQPKKLPTVYRSEYAKVSSPTYLI